MMIGDGGVGGQSSVASGGQIPHVCDARLILLWPPLLGSRSWSAGFFGPQLSAMPPDVTLERMLTPEESKVLVEGLAERAQS